MSSTEANEMEPRFLFVHPLPTPSPETTVERAELSRVNDWWPGGGLCALVGIAGSGKTDLLARFARSLRGGVFAKTDEKPGLEADATRERESVTTGAAIPSSSGPAGAPAGVFAFSFEEDPRPESFFQQLNAWIGGFDEEPNEPRSPASMRLARSSPATTETGAPTGSFLILLDGIESVQQTANDRFPGRITCEELRRWLARAATGGFPGVSVLIASELPLTDFQPASRFPALRVIPVGPLPPDAALSLLLSAPSTEEDATANRGRPFDIADGMTEDEVANLFQDERVELEWRRIAAGCAGHALTLRLLGGFIARFCDGDPRRLAADPRRRRVGDDGEPPSLDPDRLRALAAERALVSTMGRYCAALRERYPDALETMQRLALFRRPVSPDMICCALLSEPEAPSGRGLFDTPPDTGGVEKALRFLRGLSLVRRHEKGGAVVLYSLHPAVRAALRVGRDAECVRREHLAIKIALEEILSGMAEELEPSSGVALDFLEEVYHHALEAGMTLEAGNIYLHRFGGYWNLAGRLRDCERGERLCRALCDSLESRREATAGREQRLPRQTRNVIQFDLGRYRAHLGHLDDALACFDDVDVHGRCVSEEFSAQVRFVAAWVLFLRGRLQESRRTLEELIEEDASPGAAAMEPLALLALLNFLQGDVEEAERIRSRAFEIARRPENAALSNRTLAFALATFLSRRGEPRKAARLARAAMAETRAAHDRDADGDAFWESLRADLLLNAGRVLDAHTALAKAETFQRRSRFLRVMNLFTRARLETESAIVSRETTPAEADAGFARAMDLFAEALDQTRRFGFGLLHIDGLIWRGKARFDTDDLDGAEADARVALFGARVEGDDWIPGDESTQPLYRGVFTTDDSGWPALFAAAHPECGQAWGEIEARLLLARVYARRAGFSLPEESARPEPITPPLSPTSPPVAAPTNAEKPADTKPGSFIDASWTPPPAPVATPTPAPHPTPEPTTIPPSTSTREAAPPPATSDSSRSPDECGSPPSGLAPLSGAAWASPEARGFLTQAKVELRRCLELRRRLRDPREKEIRRLLGFLVVPPE